MSLDLLTATYYEIFDIPVTFQCDIDVIQQRYRELQKAVHPDKFVNAAGAEKRLSMQHTSRINEALNTLKQPVERALYLLKLKGLDINFDNETTKDMAFLMEQMELREAMENVGKDLEALNKLDILRSKVKQQSTKLMSDFSDLYESGELDKAREIIRKMQFMQKALKEVNDSAANIEDDLLG